MLSNCIKANVESRVFPGCFHLALFFNLSLVSPPTSWKCNTKSLEDSFKVVTCPENINCMFFFSTHVFITVLRQVRENAHWVLFIGLYYMGQELKICYRHEVQIGGTASCIFMMELNKVCHTSPSQDLQLKLPLPSLTSLTSEDGLDPHC